jgi:hypothetical protein
MSASEAATTPRSTSAGSNTKGGLKLDHVVSGLRAKHAPKEGGLPAKSTCGIVLDGVTVSIIVPGGPAWRHPWDTTEDHVAPGDIIQMVDGEKVDRKTIISKLRGEDVPGSVSKTLDSKP